MKEKLHFLALIFFINTAIIYGQWDQDGNTINGNIFNGKFGGSVSLSKNGKVLAVGSSGSSLNNRSYYVNVYGKNNENWEQIGESINGFNSNDTTAKVVLSEDGNTLVIGAPFNSEYGSFRGTVKVYVNNNGSWEQVGYDLRGKSDGDYFGYSVSISSDGSTIAVGAIRNDDNKTNSGQVKVYKLSDNNWTPTPFSGSSISGSNSSDYLGCSVSLSSDGNILAVSAVDDMDGINERGYVQLYKKGSFDWIKIGDNIIGDDNRDKFGRSIELSDDGKTIIIGATVGGSSSNSKGYVKVYKENNGEYIQIGQKILAENNGEYFGISVSISENGGVIAIGARDNDTNGDNSGQVKVFKNVNNNWQKIGNNMNGTNSGDGFGKSISLSGSGNKIAIGSIFYGSNNNGQVKVFSNNDVLNIKTLENIPNLKIYTINKKITTNLENLTIRIYNILGMQMENENLKNGIYIVNILDKKGRYSNIKILLK